MAAYSPSSCGPYTHPQTFDGKIAKKAVAKAAKALRALLTNNDEKLEVLVQNGLLQRKDTTNIIKELQEKVGQDPNLFGVLLREISAFPDGAEAASRLQANCPAVDQTVQVLGGLRKNLNVLKDMNPPDGVIKTAISEAIAKELKSLPANIEHIRDELSKMHQEELFSSGLFEWAITETRKEHENMLADTNSNVDYDTLLEQCTPVELGHDDLYHASMCSIVVNKSNDTEQCKKLLQSLSYRSLKQLSISQSEDRVAFSKCMIAVSSDSSVGTTCYVAFENMLDFKLWEQLGDAHKSTFGKVLEGQMEKFPTLYLETVIKRKDRLVLTGFSFGGVLAQMLAAQLWLLPQTNTSQLMSNVICITFGQPLVQSDLLTHVAESFPDFRNNVHAICLEDDSFPSIMEKLDTSTNEVRLPTVLRNLSHLQEFYHSQEQLSVAANTQVGASKHQATVSDLINQPQSGRPSSTSESQQITDERAVPNSTQSEPKSTVVQDRSRDEATKATMSNPKVLTAQRELEKLLRSQHADPGPAEPSDFAAKRHLIVCNESGLKLVEVSAPLQETLKFNRMADLISRKCFYQHSAGVYYRSVKKLAYDHKEQTAKYQEISSEFLRPVIKGVKVTQYGSEAIIVVTGRHLWFVHSLKLSSILKDPFQVQEVSVSFRANTDDFVIPENGEETEAVIFSHFSQPVMKKICVELDPNRLSPRGRQLARLEPARLLELAFMIALLEKCPNRLSYLGHHPSSESPPFYNYFRHFLREIATVVPYESMLCTVAHCQNRRTADLCMRIIKRLGIEFPFSLTMYASLFVAVFKIQHQMSSTEASMANFLDQQPFEDCAQFMWLKTKYMKRALSKAAVNSFSDELFTDPYIFGSQELFCEDALYLRKMTQSSLKQVSNLSEVKAISDKSATDLYKWCSVSSTSSSKQESRSLKSAISILMEGREILHRNSLQLNEELSRSYKETTDLLHDARGGQFDLCIGLLCGFMYQHVRVPFTEVNPMTFWKSLRHHIAPYSDVFKNDSDFWTSILNRCQRAISKGSHVAERTYDGKLKFLVTKIDPETKAQTAPVSSDYSKYAHEKKLKEVCTIRGIRKETTIDRMVRTWQNIFKDCPMAAVASTHRALISRWIKWSLMIHDLRLMLEKHTTIAITGLVNSGKTQLTRKLFGFDVKAGTTELRRTIVPFMYSLAPEVEGVHVVDLPGADDSDKNVSQLTEFLKFVSQIVLFVVSYDKAHTKDAKKWLDMFEKRYEESEELNSTGNDYSVISDHHFEASGLTSEDSNAPVLVCMTFADRLLAEILNKDGKYEEEKAKKVIAKHFEDISGAYYSQGMWKPKGRRTLGYYCFDLNKSSLSESDMRAVDIGVPSDVGRWICKQLRDEIHVRDTADRLESYFEQSCRKLK